MSVASLARKDERPDERAELRRAIAAAAEAREQVAATEAAIERSVRLVSEVRRKFEAASKAVAAARDEDAQQLAAAIVSGDTVSPQATRRAKEAETEAGDALAMARAAYKQLENDLPGVEAEAKHASKAVDAAIAAVVSPVREQMIAEAKAVRARYLVLIAALAAIGEPLQFSISDAEHRQLSSTTGARWRAAIEALKTDAGAELPSLGD
jgi:hypothetical protein